MGKPIKAERVERIRRFVQRNLESTNGSKGPIYGIFSRLAACRTISDAHQQILYMSRLQADQSRAIRGFNMVAEMDGHIPLIDMASAQIGHNGGPRFVN